MGQHLKAKDMPNKIVMVNYVIIATEVVLLVAQIWVLFSTL